MVVQSMTTFGRCRARLRCYMLGSVLFVLLKVDIAKAFDTVSWAFLIDLLRHMGFSQRWRNWVSILLSMVSTRLLLNGNPGRRIYHAQGLRLGYLLSPLLFVLVMEALIAFFHLADARGLLQHL
jgi:hypothetical protein